MEYEHQEVEWNADEELESDDEYETLESREIIGSHDEASASPDDKKSFVVPDVSADISKGKAARQQLGKYQIKSETVYYPDILILMLHRYPTNSSDIIKLCNFNMSKCTTRSSANRVPLQY